MLYSRRHRRKSLLCPTGAQVRGNLAEIPLRKIMKLPIEKNMKTRQTLVTSDVSPYAKFPYAPNTSKIKFDGRIWTVDSLAIEYVRSIRDTFDDVFGGSMKRWRAEATEILRENGVNEIITLSTLMFNSKPYEV